MRMGLRRSAVRVLTARAPDVCAALPGVCAACAVRSGDSPLEGKSAFAVEMDEVA